MVLLSFHSSPARLTACCFCKLRECAERPINAWLCSMKRVQAGQTNFDSEMQASPDILDPGGVQPLASGLKVAWEHKKAEVVAAESGFGALQCKQDPNAAPPRLCVLQF